MQERFYQLKLKKISFFLIFFSILTTWCFADYFEDGKKYLLADQPDKAVTALFAASKEAGTDPSVYLYLGVAYFRVGKYSESLNYLSIGQKKDAVNSYLYLYNIGNIYFLRKQFIIADKFFSDAIAVNAVFAPAVLNRANARIKLDNYDGALQDYKNYLNLSPDSLQRANIEKIIALLEEKAESEAKAKAYAEAKRAAEEAERLAAEQRYQDLVDEMDSNLSSVEDADSVSAGADDTIDYSEDDELD